MRLGRSPRRAEARKRQTSGAVASMDLDRAETPGPPGAARMRGGAKRPADAAQAPEPSIRPRSAALELSASCVRAGFPHPGRRGRV